MQYQVTNILRHCRLQLCIKKCSVKMVIVLTAALITLQLLMLSRPSQKSPSFLNVINELIFTEGIPSANVRNCDPKSNVAFMKIHKTGSTTMQNIFLRYADAHDLTVLMPYGHSNYFGNPSYFNRKQVPHLKEGFSYNVFCFHTRWNYGEICSQMPNDTVFVTVLREPNRLFESMYLYYDLAKFFGVSLVDFAVSDNRHTLLKRQNSRKFGRYGRNQMSFDLGLQVKDFENDTVVDGFIGTLDSQFDLVMVAEFMEESLVLLRRLMCWNVDDVIVFDHNVRINKTDSALWDPKVAQGSTRWNKADHRLYKYFVNRLSSRVQEIRQSEMEEEMERVKTRTVEWMDYCVADLVAAKFLKHSQRPYHPNTYGYSLKENVTNATCNALTMAELPFINQLRRKQLDKYDEITDSFPAPETKKKYLLKKRFNRSRRIRRN